jgi:hypothetical protein
MTLKFICGCQHEIINDQEDLGWWKEVSTDREGFLICVTHRVRREHWAALPQGASRQVSDWRKAGYSALEIEKFIVFGTPLAERPSIELDLESTPDLRDTRDPEQLGREILAASAAQGNGHA